MFAKLTGLPRMLRSLVRRGANRSEAHIRQGDRLRDAKAFDAAAEAYRAALTIDPSRADIWVQHGNMLKDSGKFQEAEKAYNIALSRAPPNADVYLQLGHLFKLQGRRNEALKNYYKALELSPELDPTWQELYDAGEVFIQEQLFGAELRSGSIDRLIEVSHEVQRLRSAIDHLASALPAASSYSACPISSYDQFRDLWGIPEPPRFDHTASFVILLLADRERLDLLRRQIVRIVDQSYQQWQLRIIGAEPSRRRVADQFIAADSRISWTETEESESPAAAELRVGTGAHPADWILLLAPGALLERHALAWFALAAAGNAAAAYITDEAHLTRQYGRQRYTDPEFRQVVDYDTLLEANPFGETVAVMQRHLANAAPELLTTTATSARSSLLLHLAHAGRIGHIPLALIAREKVTETATLDGHHEAVTAHVRRRSAEIPELGPGRGIAGRTTIRWTPGPAPASIAAIIPTRDNGADVLRCIESLRQKASRPELLRFIVMDNGTRDALSREILDRIAAEDWAMVTTVDEPFNWARLNNHAIRSVAEPLLLFVNDDVTMVSADWDDILRGQLGRREIGAVGARLLYPDDTIQHAGVLFGWPSITIHDGIYEPASAPGPGRRWQLTREVGAVTGAFLATRRDVFLAHGGFDEIGLPVQYSDIDYALKLRRSDLRVLWTPDITCYHHESKTRGLDHLDPEKHARMLGERAVLEERWGTALSYDPGVNPIWHMATLPFRLISAPSLQRLLDHMRQCASSNPWYPVSEATADSMRDRAAGRERFSGSGVL